jgi:thiosulfate/3-mercaptopyruvate sulfurtransferase
LDSCSVLDVRWDLAGPRRDDYLAAHIPGAAFVDLDAELAGPPGAGGRHPLPDAEPFTAAMRRAGVWQGRPVVVYDSATSMAAARGWWLLRYFGHPEVSVLNGGLAAWVAAGQPIASGLHEVAPGDFTAHPGGMPVLQADGAAELARRGVLLDARAPARFCGEQEPIDPVAGHIPGARNRPATQTLDADGRFLDPEDLSELFAQDGAVKGVEVGTYCGSGVAAAHELLALELADVQGALYVGSWSDWITDPTRPVATGPEPE